ncbi:hypothetical protein MAJ_06688, partial [Metarhizium majus ARSEF 297]
MGRKTKTSHSSCSIVHISAVEVAGGLALANEGKQQVKHLETDQPTRYYFSVEYSGHHSACEICISPLRVRHIQWQFGNKSVLVEVPSTFTTNATTCEETSLRSVKFLEENEPASVDNFLVVNIAKSASDKVLKALNNVEKATFAAIPYPSSRDIKTNEARLEVADLLWSLAEKQKGGAEIILWANKFYSLCMRYLLRRSGFIKTDGYRDRIAKTTVLINTVANEFCNLSSDKTCFCQSHTVYNGFARARYLLPDIPGSDGARLAVAKEITNTLRDEKLPVLADQFIFHAPAVISYLWNEDYKTVCNQLGVDSLAHHDMSNQVGKIGDAKLYTYAVHCACPCGRVTPTDEPRHNSQLIADRHANSCMAGDVIRGSDSTGGIGEDSASYMNKRPTAQQQYNDTTKRQRVVLRHANNNFQPYIPAYRQHMENDTDNDRNIPTNSSGLVLSGPNRPNATYPDIRAVTPERVSEARSADGLHALAAGAEVSRPTTQQGPNFNDKVSGYLDNAASTSNNIRGSGAGDEIEEATGDSYRPRASVIPDNATVLTNAGFANCDNSNDPTQSWGGDIGETSMTDSLRDITREFGLNEGSSLFDINFGLNEGSSLFDINFRLNDGSSAFNLNSGNAEWSLD